MTDTEARRTTYQEIARAFTLFGSVQVVNVLVQVARSKLVAILLGPSGMGILGLLNSTISFVSALTGFGLRTSAVRSIASASAASDSAASARYIVVLRRWTWLTGLLGAAVMVLGAGQLSEITFGNAEFAVHYKWVAVSLLFTQLSNGQAAQLQGLRKLGSLAKASLTGSLLSLGLSVPAYYWLGNDGIVPAIIAASFVTMLCMWGYARTIDIKAIGVSLRETLDGGQEMLALGLVLSASGLATTSVSYLVRVYIGRVGGIEQVGLYNAGFAIVHSYFDLVFASMATEYLPRLSAAVSDDDRCRRNINQQAEIAVLVLAPILVLFVLFAKQLAVLLYSSSFVGISDIIYWAALGIFFKAASWSISFVFVAKGMSRLFFVNELVANLYMLLLNFLGYHFWGLAGIGASFAVGYLLYLGQVYIVSRRLIGFSFEREFRFIFSIQFILASGCLISIFTLPAPALYLVGVALLILSSIYSLTELRKRIDLRKLLSR